MPSLGRVSAGVRTLLEKDCATFKLPFDERGWESGNTEMIIYLLHICFFNKRSTSSMLSSISITTIGEVLGQLTGNLRVADCIIYNLVVWVATAESHTLHHLQSDKGEIECF